MSSAVCLTRDREFVPLPHDIFSRTAQDPRPLLHGRYLTCPHCEQDDDVLAYAVLNYVEKYADQLAQPLRCRRCGHVFALKPPQEVFA